MVEPGAHSTVGCDIVAKAKGGWKVCEHCRSEMSLFAAVCPHCGRRAYGGVSGAARHQRQVEEAQNPGGRERLNAQKRDRDKTHAYCNTCHRRVYASEMGCEAGHVLAPDWEARFEATFGVPPEARPEGANPELVKRRAYCTACKTRIYAGELRCEAGHELNAGWEAAFRQQYGVEPEVRPGGRNLELAAPRPQPALTPPQVSDARPRRGGAVDVIGQLKELAALKSAGAISDDEFEALKARLLDE